MNNSPDPFFATELATHPPHDLHNPLLQPHDLFPYNRLEAQHIIPAAEWLMEYVKSNLTELENLTEPPSWQNTMGRLEDVQAVIIRVSVPVYNVYSLHKTDELREPFVTFNQIMVKAGMILGQSKQLYALIKTLSQSAEYQNFSSAQQRTIKRFIQSQDLSGIHLKGESQKTFLTIVDKLSQLSISYSNNVVDSMKAYAHIITDAAELSGLPPKALSALSSQYTTETQQPSTPHQGPWLIKLDQNSVSSILKYCSNAALRQKIYQDSHHRTYHGSFDNTEIIHEILKLRHHQAQLLDFNCYADMALSTRMADSTAKVTNMHEQFLQAARPGLAQEHHLLTELKREHNNDPQAILEPWDISYYRDQYIRQEFNFDPSEIALYLPLDQVLTGMFEFFKEMFGVSFQLITPSPTADNSSTTTMMWHEDVQTYKIYDEHTQTAIATLFLDLYSRPGRKNPGAWMRGERPRRRNSLNQLELAVAHIACNFSPPTDDKPCLLEFDDLTTLFHEFGHALQQTLTTVEVAAVSGTNVGEWDVVELPSQFMEYWCYQQDILKRFAFHYKTKAPLPDKLFTRMIGAKNFGNAYHYSRQVALGMIDMKLHTLTENIDDAYTAYQEILSQIYPFQQPNEYQNKMLSFFSHIFAGGYSAGYYSYLWARIYSADAFAYFEEAGLNDLKQRQELGLKFKNTILALGGSEKPSEIYYKFRNSYEASPDALIRHEGLLTS